MTPALRNLIRLSRGTTYTKYADSEQLLVGDTNACPRGDRTPRISNNTKDGINLVTLAKS